MTSAREKAPTFDLRSVAAVGLGGNVGPVRDTFVRTLEALERESPVIAVSSLYRSAPIGPAQPPYLNAAVLVRWTSPLADLLEVLQRLEQRAGRVRELRWGPRTLDLDLLWAGDRSSNTSSLTVPHPRLVERRFALQPLLEIAPDARESIGGPPLAESLARLEKQEVEKVAASPW